MLSTILAASTASSHVGNESLPLLYEMAIEEVTKDEEAITIARRLKETLLKGSVLFGIPPCLDSLFALEARIKKDVKGNPGRDDDGFSPRKGQSPFDKEVMERGRQQLKTIYRHNFDDIRPRFGNDSEFRSAYNLSGLSIRSTLFYQKYQQCLLYL